MHQNNVAVSNRYNSPCAFPDTLHRSRPLYPVIMSDSVIPHYCPPKPQPLEIKYKESKPEDKRDTANQCRLRRIQSRDRVTITDTVQIPQSAPAWPSPAVAATRTHLNSDDTSALAHPNESLSYSFPPPGLSKPTPKTMITPETDAAITAPGECDSVNAAEAATDSEASIWNAFQMVSFLGGYCTGNNRSALAPSTDHDSLSPPATPLLAPASLPPRDLTTNSHPVLTPRPRQTTPTPNPFVLHRQRQQAFMSSWKRVREKNKHAPVMPSFFNPARSETPACAWTFLRDPACGNGSTDDHLHGRRGKSGVFERALASLPLTRCRNICDGVRQEQQNLLGWGIHAWSGPSKHCRYCAGDTLLKGLLAYRAFEVEMRRERYSMLLSPSAFDIHHAAAADRMDPADSSEAQGRDDEEMEADSGTVFLSFPYGNRSMERLNESWINYNDLDSTSGLHSHTGESEDPDNGEVWSEELEKQLLQSPVLRDLDEFELEEDAFEAEYANDEDEDDSSSSGSDMSESDEEAEAAIGNGKKEGEGEKVRGTVLMTFWEEDEDVEEEAWVGDVQVVGMQIQACA